MIWVLLGSTSAGLAGHESTLAPGAYLWPMASLKAHPRPERGSGLVWVRRAAALLVLAVGAIHLYLWFDFFHRVHVVGTLFLLNAAAGGLLALALLRGNALALAAAAGYSATTLAAFFVSTKWGLFGYTESLWGRWQEAAGATELAATLLLVMLIALGRSRVA
jgi:hypothetical protein